MVVKRQLEDDLKIGLSSLSGDCDDNDPSRSPSSVELCDNIDNNCNEEIDEGFL